jgi:signal transduction histidine kinase/predicted RNA-binding protein with RPS1 domain/CheY-like chemotaxis protein
MEKLDWHTVVEKHSIGEQVDGVVREVWQHGALVELEDGAQGLVRNKEIAWDPDFLASEPVASALKSVKSDQFVWDREVKDTREVLHIDQKVRVCVLEADSRREQLILSIRRAVYDPWEHQGTKYQVGKTVRGAVNWISGRSAFIEFEDHIEARLPSENIVPWGISSIEQVVEVGDFIEAVIKQRDEAAREIVLSMRQRLQDLAQELSGATQEGAAEWASEPGTEERKAGPMEMPTADASVHTVPSAILRGKILVVDDEEDVALQLQAMLEDAGFEEVDVARSIEDCVFKAFRDTYSVVLIDVRLPGDDLGGVHAAERVLAAKPEACIVLITGDNWQESAKQGQEMALAGMLRKPITQDKLVKALEGLARTGYIGWPVQQSEEEREAVEFMEGISRSASVRRPLRQVLEDTLGELQKATRAKRAGVFSLDPQTGAVELEAAIGIGDEEFKRARFKLRASPVTDVIYRGEHILENFVHRFEGKFRNLRPLTRFESCVGVPVQGAAGGLGHGLFLFHDQPVHFTKDDLIRTEAAALVIGTVIREYWLIENVAADQRFTALGGLYSSVGHELKGRFQALQAADSAARAWARLKHESGLLDDPDFVAKMDQHFHRLNAARGKMEELVDMLLSMVGRTEEKVVNVRQCLNRAIRAVAHEAAGNGVDLLPSIGWIPYAQGNPIELEQVFLNILLNAVQQMPLARRKRGRVIIETEYCPKDNHLPIKVRFADSGPGIHSKYLDRIFEPMFTTKVRGTGMGLYLCEGLLASMGGRISVEKTAVLIGTTFLVELPQAG